MFTHALVGRSRTHRLPLGTGAGNPSNMYTQQSVFYPPCFLIGARASGKSTMGAVLAQALTVALFPTATRPVDTVEPAGTAPAATERWCFLDTDDLLVRASGESIADYVAGVGWETFRRRESQALRAATAPATVLATGGGCILAPDNRAFMREQGCVVYLHAPAAVLVERLQSSPRAEQRPSLTGADICAEMDEVLAVREPLYRATAHAVIDCTQEESEVLKALLRAYGVFLAERAQMRI